jgi:outer membrane protein assembly factor BamB
LGTAFYPNGGVGTDDGPRSTPSVEGDRVYVLTTYLGLFCLSITNGAVIWSKDLMTEYGSDIIEWQSAASPLIEGDLVFVMADAPNQSLLAFHKSDGSEAWKGQSDVMTQASPIAATIAGVRQVIYFTKSGLVSVAPTNGAVLWRYPFRFSTSTAASPVVGNDVVYCSAAYGGGAGTVRISNEGGELKPIEVWRFPFVTPLMNHWATPVLHNGYLFGFFGQQGSNLRLRCVEFATGTNQWSRSDFGTGGVLFVAGHVLVLEEDGSLVLVKPDPAAYTEVARYRALDGSSNSIPGLAVKCWNVPAISNGRIYARSTTEAICLDVAVAAPPTNFPPNTPTNVAPPDGATNQLFTLTLQASAFNDPDGDSHASSRWVIKRSPDNTIVFDSGNDTNNKTSIAVPMGVLSNSTTYSWSVSYMDSNSAEGPGSTQTLFLTQPLAPLKLFSTLTSGTGLFQLLIGGADGSSLDTNRAAGIDVFASTDLTLGLSGWIKLNSALTFTNGRLSLDDPQSPDTAQRFFRVEERP